MRVLCATDLMRNKLTEVLNKLYINAVITAFLYTLLIPNGEIHPLHFSSLYVWACMWISGLPCEAAVKQLEGPQWGHIFHPFFLCWSGDSNQQPPDHSLAFSNLCTTPQILWGKEAILDFKSRVGVIPLTFSQNSNIWRCSCWFFFFSNLERCNFYFQVLLYSKLIFEC